MTKRAEVCFFVPGEPQGKGRARSFIKRGAAGKPAIGHYTPDKTRTYEGVITSLALDARNDPPFTGPVRVELTIWKSIPASWPKWKRELALQEKIRPTNKPDSDNVEKAVKDACNGVLWIDDCQIVEDMKRAHFTADRPGVYVRVIPLPEHPSSITTRPA